MNCESVKRLLSLYLYGELSFDEEELVAQHLDQCAGCRQDLQREQAMHRAMDEAEAVPPPGLLAACRRELPRRLGASRRQTWLEWLRGTGMAWLRPAAAAALIALGFVAARITVTSPSSEAIATRVRSVEPSAAGAVRVVVEETRQRVVSGRLDEEPIQQLLLAAARDSSDPGLRLESVDLLKNKCDSEEVRHALLYALQNDPNAGVRLKVMEGLKRFAGDAESRKVLAKVLLTDDNPGVRIQAVDLLTQNNETDVVGVLQQLLRKEDNNYVRVRSQNALRAMNASWGTF